jgi:hypothetical protein
MESLVFKIFEALFKIVLVLIVAGTFGRAILDLEKHATSKHRTGLVSLLQINQQLVGKSR